MIRTVLLPVAALACLSVMPAVAQQPPESRQIMEALSALPAQPASLRAEATVLGYRGGALVALRSATGTMVCLADDPAESGFHVACYHRDLEPFMARGRALRAQGVTGREQIDSIRQAEIESGRLPFPRRPMALYSWSGDSATVDAQGNVHRARGLYVVYMPYATEAETGIPAAPARDRPWLMFPGKPWAHVMIGRSSP